MIYEGSLRHVFLILSIIVAISTVYCESVVATERFLEKELTENCNSLFPNSVSMRSICLNATGTCVVMYIRDRKDSLSENKAMEAIEACTKLQYEANSQYIAWAEKNGIQDLYRSYIAGGVSLEKAMKNELFKDTTECRISSKTGGYTNYHRMLECIKSL